MTDTPMFPANAEERRQALDRLQSWLDADSAKPGGRKRFFHVRYIRDRLREGDQFPAHGWVQLLIEMQVELPEDAP